MPIENTITLKNVRLSFPQLWTPKQAQAGEGEPAFNANVLITPDDPQIKDIEKLIEHVALQKWGPKAAAILKGLRTSDKVCLHNGDNKAQWEGYEGNYYLSARNAIKPLVLDRDCTELQQKDGRPYGGCYVDFNVQIYAQDNQFGKRINASLRWVQFRRNGDAFSKLPPATVDEVPEIVDEDDAVDPTAM